MMMTTSQFKRRRHNMIKMKRGKSRATMVGIDFIRWRHRHGLDRQGAANALGVKLRAIYFYEHDERKISKTMALLCKAYDAGF